jgi:hypothetical protein
MREKMRLLRYSASPMPSSPIEVLNCSGVMQPSEVNEEKRWVIFSMSGWWVGYRIR